MISCNSFSNYPLSQKSSPIRSTVPRRPSMAVASPRNSFAVASLLTEAFCLIRQPAAVMDSLLAPLVRTRAVVAGARSLRRGLLMRRRKSRAPPSRLWLRRRRGRGRARGCFKLSWLSSSIKRSSERTIHMTLYHGWLVFFVNEIQDNLIDLGMHNIVLTLFCCCRNRNDRATPQYYKHQDIHSSQLVNDCWNDNNIRRF